MESRLVIGKEPGIRRALRRHFGRSSQMSIHLEAEKQRWDKDVD